MTYWGNTTVGVTTYDIISDKLPADFDHYKIIQLSDLHDAEFGDHHEQVVNKVTMLAPNAIFITGDFIDSNRYNLEQSLVLVEELQSVAPMYYVTGNHEIATNDTERIKGALENLGVKVLSDEAEIITSSEGNAIAIGGIEDPMSSSLDDNEAVEASIRQAFEQVPDEVFKLLLSHRPEQFEVYAERGIDVTFSGHAHGGQFRIPGLGGLVAPGQGWFPVYTSGVHDNNGSRMIVSRGLGNSIIPIRIFNQPEIVVVTLRKENR
ncbi:metallophosphoesterase [Sporosarcina sp. YIM B06819]|uniref:metallophosphoesterase n=1 Tax=Sporosarcina sp. YIM B06819 TaxID=3081769 RepID=UPI00298C0FB7|nr:metallophosphoesterase [Sporosarcina sp. YIM B06819]